MTTDKKKIELACASLQCWHGIYVKAATKGGTYSPNLLVVLQTVQLCCQWLNLTCSVRVSPLTENQYASTRDVFIADFPKDFGLVPYSTDDYYNRCVIFYRNDTAQAKSRKMRLLLLSLLHYAKKHETLTDNELLQIYESSD